MNHTNNSEQNENEQKNENYEFLKETIKERPVDRKKLLQKAGFLAAGGILFGFMAAVTFAYVAPEMLDNVAVHKNSYVDIPEDEEPDSTLSSLENEEISKEELHQREEALKHAAVMDSMEEGKLTLEDYEKLHLKLTGNIEETKRSMVTVTGSVNNEAWFQNPSENQITGLIVAENEQDMFILTEYRIVKNVDRIQVVFYDGFSIDARFQKADKNTGYTILKVPLEEIPQKTKNEIKTAPLGNSYGVCQGEPVVAIGSPMGYSDSVTYGIITSISNTVQKIDSEYGILTTDIVGAADASGIITNLHGEVVGIIAQSFAREDMKNIITCLAISQTKELIEALSNDSDIPYVGIVGKTVTADVSDQKGIPKGVFVENVEVDSPAMQAGIKNADVIVELNGQNINDLKKYQQELKKCKGGSQIKLKAMRQGTEGYVEVEFEVTVGVY